MRKGERHEGDEPAVPSRRPWKALQPGPSHVQSTERFRQPIQRVEGDKHGRLRKHIMQGKEDAVGPTQGDEPIVDERDAQ
jgi:hypothetical protein